MAANLVKKYPDLLVYDIVEDNVKRVLAAGPTATGTEDYGCKIASDTHQE